MLRLSVLLLAAITLASCSFLPRNTEDGPMVLPRSFTMESLDDQAKRRFQSVLDAIESRDGDAIKAMFSERALAEAEDIDAAIEYLFNLFDGEIVSCEGGSMGESESIEYGKSSRLLRSDFTVFTEKSEYLFWLLDYTKNTIDPDLEGLYTLHGIDAAYVETQLWDVWQELKSPGIYLPPPESFGISPQEQARRKFQLILDAIEARDPDAIKAMFSKGALEEAEDIDAAIEYLFSLFDGEVESWELNYDPTEIDEFGKPRKLLRSNFHVRTDNGGGYKFILFEYTENEISEDLLGLYTLYGVRYDDYLMDGNWNFWDYVIPGVYMPPE